MHTAKELAVEVERLIVESRKAIDIMQKNQYDWAALALKLKALNLENESHGGSSSQQS